MSAPRALRVAAFVTVVLASMAAPPPAASHPHAWIDLRTSVVLGPQGRVVAVEQEWFIDPLYSALLIEDLGTTPQARRTHGAEMLGRLKEYGYFTQVRVDGEIQAVGTVRDFSVELRSNRYWIRFLMPLETSVDPTTAELSYSVFDPTYYIDIRHPEEDVIAFRGVEPGRCEAQIQPPTPSAAAIARAGSPTADVTPDNSLGALFAERVDVACG